MSILSEFLTPHSAFCVSPVNPTQFNDPSDLLNYPRTFDNDLALAQQAGVDFILLPDYQQLYPDDYRYKVIENIFSQKLCGKDRPRHFEGILTIVLKLLLLAKANIAYFGEKDYQQLQLVTDMTAAFFIDTEIVSCATIRAKSGLALSSRNNLLTPAELTHAAIFYQLLNSAAALAEIKTKLIAEGFKIDYLEEYESRRFGAVKLGNIRLIDNIKQV